jgi:hypothetical protein
LEADKLGILNSVRRLNGSGKRLEDILDISPEMCEAGVIAE